MVAQHVFTSLGKKIVFLGIMLESVQRVLLSLYIHKLIRTKDVQKIICLG